MFKKKFEIGGQLKYTARLVTRGFRDKNPYALKETYALVSTLSLIKATIFTCNEEDLEICQMDVKTALLNGKVNE